MPQFDLSPTAIQASEDRRREHLLSAATGAAVIVTWSAITIVPALLVGYPPLSVGLWAAWGVWVCFGGFLILGGPLADSYYGPPTRLDVDRQGIVLLFRESRPRRWSWADSRKWFELVDCSGVRTRSAPAVVHYLRKLPGAPYRVWIPEAAAVALLDAAQSAGVTLTYHVIERRRGFPPGSRVYVNLARRSL